MLTNAVKTEKNVLKIALTQSRLCYLSIQNNPVHAIWHTSKSVHFVYWTRP